MKFLVTGATGNIGSYLIKNSLNGSFGKLLDEINQISIIPRNLMDSYGT